MLTGGVVSVDWMGAKVPPDMLTGLMSKKVSHEYACAHTVTNSPAFHYVLQIVLSCPKDKLASSQPVV